MYQGYKYKYDDNRKIVMECQLKVLKWSTTLLLSVKGQVVQQKTYFNFFTTLSDLGPVWGWSWILHSGGSREVTQTELCPHMSVLSV